jgi:hypothetical protein
MIFMGQAEKLGLDWLKSMDICRQLSSSFFNHLEYAFSRLRERCFGYRAMPSCDSENIISEIAKDSLGYCDNHVEQ